MKRIILAILLSPSLSFGAPFDMFINQRNIADSATLSRTVSIPTLGVNSVFGTSDANNLPIMWKIGSSIGVLSGELVAFPDWNLVQNKPNFAAVATSGNYNDLTNKPSTAAQVNSDWLATSGVEQVLNKPSLAVVATSGAYADLSGKPSIPAAQVNSDWSATSGVAQILNKPVKSQASAARSLNTAFQISTTRDADVRYSVQCTITASISGGQQCDVILEIASDSAFTSNVQTLGIVGTGQTYTLAVALQGVAPQTAQVTGYVPAGYYARLRTVNVTGSPTYQFRAGQEVLQ